MNLPVRATANRVLGEMRFFGAGLSDGAQLHMGREAVRSVVVAYDELKTALQTVDSMLAAGASPGTLHAIIEQSLDAGLGSEPSPLKEPGQ